MKTSDFDYELPEELIAQHPAPERSAARMMVLRRDSGTLEHRHFRDLPGYLEPRDLLVANDTRVLPCRVYGRKRASGGKVEIFFLEPVDGEDGVWEALIRASRPLAPGQEVELGDGGLVVTVLERGPRGPARVRIPAGFDLHAFLSRQGHIPLPPYIRREDTAADRESYQTIYARAPGAVAAPTAGLHFTPQVMAELEARGVRRALVTLHVGWGTFRPVTAENAADHVVESERYHIAADVAQAVSACRAAKGRIVAVGTTTVRALETAARDGQGVAAGEGRSTLFIHPPYRFQIVGALLTNFHLPQSSLLMLVSAFAGPDFVMQAYREAVRLRYRFYSYGDCMLVL